MLVRIANWEDPDQTVSSEAVYAVCLRFFGWHLVIEILGHLPYFVLSAYVFKWVDIIP